MYIIFFQGDDMKTISEKDDEANKPELEKAFAKFCGSYAALEGGDTVWAIRAMTPPRVID